MVWKPLEAIEEPVAVNSPLKLKSSAGLLPGALHKHVQVTPSGHRSHTIKHTSPGGTTRVEEYSSPAGVPQLTRNERSAWRMRVAGERRAAAAALRLDERPQAKRTAQGLAAACTGPPCVPTNVAVACACAATVDIEDNASSSEEDVM